MKVIRTSQNSKIILDGDGSLIINKTDRACLDIKIGKHRPMWIRNFYFVGLGNNKFKDKVKCMINVWKFIK